MRKSPFAVVFSGPTHMKPCSYSAAAALKDGTPASIRSIGPNDKPRLVELFQRLSARSVYFRFFHSKQRLTEGDLAELTELDFDHRAALAATVRENGDDRIIGVIRYTVVAGSPAYRRRAEVNFAVTDEHQGRGVGKLLLRHLVLFARGRGIAEFEAYVLPENKRMLALFDGSGYKIARTLESGVIHIRFPIGDTR